MIATVLSTLVLPLTVAVLTGILLSLAYYLLQTSTPRVRTVLPDETFEYLVPSPDGPHCPQLGIIEILGDLYFGAVRHIEECILENHKKNPSQRFLLLRMFSVEQIDISGIHALEGITRSYREQGGDIFISRFQKPVIKAMQDTGFIKILGEDHFLGRDQDAIGYLFYHVLDPAICIYECPYHVFQECQNLPKRLDLIGDIPHMGIPNGIINYIDPITLWDSIHKDPKPIIIDVREPREYQKGHIPDARSVPTIVLVCQGGRRSTRAACMLREEGNDHLHVLKGGMTAWESANMLEAINEEEKNG